MVLLDNSFKQFSATVHIHKTDRDPEYHLGLADDDQETQQVALIILFSMSV